MRMGQLSRGETHLCGKQCAAAFANKAERISSTLASQVSQSVAEKLSEFQ